MTAADAALIAAHNATWDANKWARTVADPNAAKVTPSAVILTVTPYVWERYLESLAVEAEMQEQAS